MSFSPKSPSTAALSEAGFTFEPIYPDGTGISATITVRGPEAAEVRNLLRMQISALQAREIQAKKRGRDAELVSIEELEAQAVDLAVAYTIGWSGFEDAGQPIEPTEPAVRALYREHSWIRRQVIEQAQDLGNFVRPASRGSSPTPKPSSDST